MDAIKRFFSDLLAILLIAVGVSTTRTTRKDLELRKLVSDANHASGEKWVLINRAASGVEYGNRRAVGFDSRSSAGLAWVEGLRFSKGKIDLDIAAIPQDVGMAFHVRNEREFEAVCFHIGDEARNESESQRVIVRYFSTYPGRSVKREAQFDLPYGQSGEWFKARLSISREVVAVFINGANLPTLSVDAPGGADVYGSVGLWIGPGSSALVTDFRIHVAGGDIEKQIRSIFGR